MHPNSRKTTNTAGTQPPGLLCPEAQVNRARNMTPRTHVNEEDGEDGVEHEDEEDEEDDHARHGEA